MLIIPKEPHQDSIDEIKLVHCGTSIACAFGMGTGVSLWGFTKVFEAARESMDTLPPLSYCITDMHPDVLSIAGLAVRIAVAVNPSSSLLNVARCNGYFEIGAATRGHNHTKLWRLSKLKVIFMNIHPRPPFIVVLAIECFILTCNS